MKNQSSSKISKLNDLADHKIKHTKIPRDSSIPNSKDNKEVHYFTLVRGYFVETYETKNYSYVKKYEAFKRKLNSPWTEEALVVLFFISTLKT